MQTRQWLDIKHAALAAASSSACIAYMSEHKNDVLRTFKNPFKNREILVRETVKSTIYNTFNAASHATKNNSKFLHSFVEDITNDFSILKN